MLFLRPWLTARLSVRVPQPRAIAASVVAPYLLVLVVTAAITFFGMKLRRADLHAPHHYVTDSLLILPMVKSTVETGTHWRNERLGYPGVQETHDFPVVDHWHFLALRILGWCGCDAILAYNLYYWLTYPLTAFVTLLVLRQLGVSRAMGIAMSIAYAFQAYHMRRGEGHVFLAAYYLNPLALLAAIRVAGPLDGPLFSIRSQRLWAGLFIAVATATGGAYYAFFSCAFLATATLYGTFAFGRRSLAAGLAMLLAITAVGVVSHAPTIVYQRENGAHTNPTLRYSLEAEQYGYRLVQLFLPHWFHRDDDFRETLRRYELPPREMNENKNATLGLLASVGLIGLLIGVIRPSSPTVLHATSILALVGVVIGMMGGLGALFATVVWPQVRSYNRISIHIAFLALFAFAVVADRLTQSLRGRNWARGVLAVACSALAIWDQTPWFWFTSEADSRRRPWMERYQVDAAYFAQVEAALPPGAVVLNQPYIRWPEEGHEHARGYLHTNTLRWSYGSIRGRESDLWNRELSIQPVDDLVRRAVVRGFSALYYDHNQRRADHAGPTLEQFTAAFARVGVTPIVHPDGKQFTWDLRPIRDLIVRNIGEEGFAKLAKQDAERPTILWLHGFDTWQPWGHEDGYRWFDRHGVMSIVNPSNRVRTLRWETMIGLKDAEMGRLSIEGALLPRVTWDLRKGQDQRWQAEVVVPPGKHLIHFRFHPTAVYRPSWPSDVVHLMNWKLTIGD